MATLDDFLDAVRAEIGDAPDAAKVMPGKLVRFSTSGKRGDDSGWCLFFADERGGVFGDWRSGAEHVWHGEHASRLTAIDRELRARDIARSMAERSAEDKRRHAHAASEAAALFGRAVPFIAHAYSDRKRMPTTGLRMLRGDGRSSPFFVTGADGRVERLRDDLILVPMCDSDRVLWSLQAIDTAGRKSFLRGGRTRGMSFVIARHLFQGVDLEAFSGEVAIVEGLATGFAVHALSGAATFVAFSAGNLAPVAKAVRNSLPRARIIVAGDVDRSGAGQKAAEDAAAAVRGEVSFPPFKPDEIRAGMTDWCDWSLAHPSDAHRKRVG